MKEKGAEKESENYVSYSNVRSKTCSRRELIMNKQAKKNIYRPVEVFDQFIKEVFVKSPLEEAFKRWRETTKEINKMRKEKQNEK